MKKLKKHSETIQVHALRLKLKINMPWNQGEKHYQSIHTRLIDADYSMAA